MHEPPTPRPASGRRFLLLQGPHGPFFAALGRRLRAAGAEVWRVGFNRGDEAFWRGPGYIAFRDPPEDWPGTCARLIADRRITDLVLYGDTRPVHAAAITLARAAGVTVHVFEEGYLRPYWATYERNGSNGNSRLMRIPVAEMRRVLDRAGDLPPAPARWGDMRQHVFYGALYHFLILTLNRRYRNFRSHREIPVAREFRLHLRRLMLMPLAYVARIAATARIRRGARPYHLVLLQLEHDASFRSHSDFASMADFVTRCLDGFARGAPPHHHLVFKAHPLEDGRGGVAATIRREAARRGLGARVHYLAGGKLAPLLDGASSAVTINSTAGQQVLWRGLPLKALGRAVYSKPEFVSPQPLEAFFARPEPPDPRAYAVYRQYLMETSQLPGGFYSRRGRRLLLQRCIAMMLAPEDPYDSLRHRTAAAWQQSRPSRTGA
ncbi:capsule biosynthesis protein [Albidovulum sp.]